MFFWRNSARLRVTESARFAGHFTKDVSDNAEAFVNFFGRNIDGWQQPDDRALSSVDQKPLLHAFADGGHGRDRWRSGGQ